MSTNFNVKSAESTLYYDATAECIDMFGIPLKYIRANNKNLDSILGEFQHQVYDATEVYDIYGILENPTAFEGQDLYSKFGITIQDSCNIFVSDKTWQNLGFFPASGDIIYWIDANTALEVTRASRELEESGFYLGGRTAIAWKVITKKHTFDNDTFSTGIEKIDNTLQNIVTADNKIPTNIDNAINSILDDVEKSPWE